MTEIIPGLQGSIPSNSKKGIPFVAVRKKVAACAKHDVGDGGATKGINENNTVIDWHGLFSIHMPGYYNAIINGVSTVMISYCSWNGVKMHGNYNLITGFLKDTLKFRGNLSILSSRTELFGFVISDWQGLDRITSLPLANYSYSIQLGIHASIDMVSSFDIEITHSLTCCGFHQEQLTRFMNDLTFQVKNNIIPMSRINDAVKRILRVKFQMGLFENPLADTSLVHELGSKPVLPLPQRANKILVAGRHADNLGYQSGGWTIEWQGLDGNNLTEAIKKTVDPKTKLVYKENPNTKYVKSNKFSYAIVVVGEQPYAETFGDGMNLTISYPGSGTITNVCVALKCVVVAISDRPVLIKPYLACIDALVAAWLPGTEGQGVADALFGDYAFTGKLPRAWFKSVDQLPTNVGDPHYDSLFPFGFGLATAPNKGH
ncbi:hypothetical protein Cgig2_025010 [Carnegiea gigantea]|uniref:Beta-glucosidase n=1 Tax=Carnegiea gigantea TaxID=171969 RepID=A0A9Q1GPX1_9CARY|nr:hypothetical protein Cgig2_025010 [Carnegiea gigantea]